MNNTWEIKKRDRHISAFLSKDIIIDDTLYEVKSTIHSKISPDMGGYNFSWDVRLGRLHISGCGHNLEKCKTFVEIATNEIIKLYNTMYGS